MLQLLIQVVIALLIAGFIFWAVRYIVSVVPLDPIIARVIDALLVIAVVAIIIFYVVIPLLNMLAGVHITIPQLTR